MTTCVKKRGRPKLRIVLNASDRSVLKKLRDGEANTRRETVIANCLLLAGTGDYTYKEISHEIRAINLSIAPADIQSLPHVLRRLNHHRIPGVWEVWCRLSPQTRTEVIKDGGRALNEHLRSILASDLNAIVHGGCVFNPSHFAFLTGEEELRLEFRKDLDGIELCKFNRKVLVHILDGKIKSKPQLQAAVSQIQTWVKRYRTSGLGVLANRHARPRIGIDFNRLILLIKAIEKGNIRDGLGVMCYLRQPPPLRLTLSTAERLLRNWKRLDSLPLPSRIMTFLVINGFIHRFATIHHPEVQKMLNQLRANIQKNHAGCRATPQNNAATMPPDRVQRCTKRCTK